jgi:hypothetical protein
MLKSVNWYSVQVYDFTSDDLQDLGEIGRGAFGTVNKMVHRRSNTVMAVKVEYPILIVKFALVKIEWNWNVLVIDFTSLWFCAFVCWYCWKYYTCNVYLSLNLSFIIVFQVLGLLFLLWNPCVIWFLPIWIPQWCFYVPLGEYSNVGTEEWMCGGETSTLGQCD